MEAKLKAISDEREKDYGPPQLSHANIGLNWTGAIQQHYGIVLDHPIPDFLVALMMGQLKIQRAARGTVKADTYDDLHVFGHFAQDFLAPPPKPVESKRKIAYGLTSKRIAKTKVKKSG